MSERIYLSPPHLSGKEAQYINQALDANWVASTGEHLDAFEAATAERCGVKHAVAVSSGTAALHLCLRLLGIGPKDEVLIPSLTFIASAAAAVQAGATPVFVDSEHTSWNIDPDRLGEAIDDGRRRGKRAKALIAVDIYGQCADYHRLLPICQDAGIPLIEDAAEALGASYRGQPAGSFGELAILSFNGNKIVTAGGGGMLLTNDHRHADRARFLATQARDPAPHYQHSTVGYNYRLSNLLAGVGRAQLSVLDQRIAARKANFIAYRQSLGQLPGISVMPIADWGSPNYWLSCILIDKARFGTDREAIRQRLEAENIEARPLWKPLHLQPVFADTRVYGGEMVAQLFERGLCLPSGSALTDEQRLKIIEIISQTH